MAAIMLQYILELFFCDQDSKPEWTNIFHEMCCKAAFSCKRNSKYFLLSTFVNDCVKISLICNCIGIGNWKNDTQLPKRINHLLKLFTIGICLIKAALQFMKFKMWVNNHERLFFLWSVCSVKAWTFFKPTQPFSFVSILFFRNFAALCVPKTISQNDFCICSFFVGFFSVDETVKSIPILCFKVFVPNSLCCSGKSQLIFLDFLCYTPF